MVYAEAHINESNQILTELVGQSSISAQRLGLDKAPDHVKRLREDAGLAAAIWLVVEEGLPSVLGEAASTSPHTVMF